MVGLSVLPSSPPLLHLILHRQSAFINILRGQRSTVGTIIISPLIRKSSFSHCEMEGGGARNEDGTPN